MKSITRNTFVYLWANFLVTVAYSMPHSILTVILLSKGLSLSQILIVQSAYFIFIFVFYVIEFILNYYFNKMVSIDNISSLVSFKSTISRLGSICLLCLLSLMVKVFAVEKVMAVNFMASLLFLFLLVIIWLRKQPKLTK